MKNIASSPWDSIQVPVEEFLQRITRRNPLRKYGRQRCRIVETSSSSPVQDDHDFSLAPRRLKRRRTVSTNHHASLSPGNLSPAASGKELPGRSQKGAKAKAKSLAERLFQASVMSHGNPADCLINPVILGSGIPSSRLPLQFVAETPRLSEAKRRTWTLVDPKKAVPFRSASFLSHRSLRDSEVISFKPLTRWRDSAPRDALGSPRKRRTSLTPANKFPIKPLGCPPLSFIPVQDAEQTYFLRLHPNGLLPTTLQLPSSVLESENATRTSLHFVTPSGLNNSQDVSMRHSSPSSTNLLESSSPQLPTCKASLLSLKCSEQLINHARTLDTTDWNVEDTLSGFLPSSSSPLPRLSNKPLKPLASFFENFLERGRYAAQIKSTMLKFKSIG